MIIGLTGKNCAGKGEIAKLITGFGFKYYSFSDLLRSEAKKRKIKVTRENLIKLANDLRKEKGPGFLAKLILEKIDGNSVIESIRNVYEIKELEKRKDFILVGVDADLKTRFERSKKRDREEDGRTIRDFRFKENLENKDYKYNQNLDACLKKAKLIIKNDSSLDDLKSKVMMLMKEQIQKLNKDFRRPSWDEYFMAIAIIVSSRATCTNVRAGSVIVLDKRIIGTGYNGAPAGIKRNCLETGCRKEKKGLDFKESLNTGNCIGIHAEMNALANLSREIHQGATLYTTIFPCPTCAKNLLAYNIKRVVYKREYDKDETRLSLALFKEGGIKVDKLDISEKRMMELAFNQHNVRFDIFD